MPSLLPLCILVIFVAVLSTTAPAPKGSSGGEHRKSLLRLIKEVGGGEKEMVHKRNEPGIYAGSDSIRDGEGKRRRKRESPNEDNVLNIQLAVFIDSSLVYHFHQRNPKEPMAKIDQVMRNMTEMLVDSVELQLNHHTLGQDFSIEIVHFEHGFSVPAPQETYLEKFCLWQKQRKITCQCHWDYAVLLTGPGIYSQRTGDWTTGWETYGIGSIGMSYQGGMCTEVRSCSVVFDQHKLALGMEISEEDLDKTSSTMAHELVHAMGVAHDGAEGNQDCAGDGLIMDPIYNGATEWSACSKRSLARFVNSYAGDCLRDDSPPIPKPKQSLRGVFKIPNFIIPPFIIPKNTKNIKIELL